MNGPKALWLAATMMTVALAGCTSGGSGGALDMFVTASEDPVTAPYTFKATGKSADNYTWDFGDGITAEGKEVEHIFGFSNGDITVKLTACTAGECESVLRKVPLGGNKNIPPAGSFLATTQWATVGETVVLDASGSSDPNGDPILYRWNCERLEALRPPDDGGGHSHGPAGVPFGVNALATLDDTLSGGNAHGAGLCSDFDLDVDQRWSKDNGKLEGSFTQTGLYRIEVFVRDPKSAAWVGRLDLYVSETRPEAVTTIPLSGSLIGGSQGSVQENCVTLAQGPCPEDFDSQERTFNVDIPNKLATVTVTSGNGAQSGIINWAIKVGEGTVQSATTDSPKLLGPLAFINGKEYRFIVEIEGISAQVDWSAELVIENDLDPRHLFQLAPN